MKVFISWSGETSKNIAEILRQWMPSVIQSVKPYYSPDDITKGTRWSSEIAKELDESKLGIICLTPDNLESSWIMFEAGALSKNIDKSKVCPILFGVDPADIKGPLVQFQAAKFNKEEIKKVVKMINSELADSSLSTEVFESVFEMWWPRLSEKIEAELKKANKTDGKEIRAERDILEEILSLSRTLSLRREREFDLDEISIHPGAVEDLVMAFASIVNTVHNSEEYHTEIIEGLSSIQMPVKYMAEKITLSRSARRRFYEILEETDVKLSNMKNVVSTPRRVRRKVVIEDSKDK